MRQMQVKRLWRNVEVLVAQGWQARGRTCTDAALNFMSD